MLVQCYIDAIQPLSCGNIYDPNGIEYVLYVNTKTYVVRVVFFVYLLKGVHDNYNRIARAFRCGTMKKLIRF